MSLLKFYDFKVLGDARGSLVSLEANINIPFEIKRVYYIFGTQQGVARGFHAHKKLKQVAICLSGSCRFLMDNGIDKEETILNSNAQGLLIDVMQWHEMYDFSDDCVLMVLASDHYDETDYIRDYSEFLRSEKK
ncbi:sugar 3,4-ketoisomerase [Vibrio cholerae]|uniref:sugar 3,4-ketoisomerase n=1 Tax=Vibrio cholerae TaxID=666 RepID=UPI001C12433C|nr:FdtA/QdtA family cupin domain-containing protein [Vibrio cholerae]MBU5690556.1 WxcM-like domain-containing protein [Vibrio cholerae]